ncbi:hypothetical protein A2130_00705 [Candidatus Woesebacteria bacterium GWC2_33_12]|uniref:Polymerase III, delta prime subunit protein n=1 Tax=Candidatus Woesebacteria bacterium GW2011_GWB1_33_22 TaxID=1618566 RepID=A0A0F9ZM95_9BACT|nr:MAG: hypothetical protein UR29_C0002G0034 [Candidatus Woesebacteria bacterium GW2011_GWC2_33_12]KKP42506.1 MAG: hypothetical protein UR33_C0002G0082 [Candidatus Woesebacteria bacterium GW2011_GWA2_33_20]KKP45249.1 MAG: hypothetical protein UR35_C0002G0082 [Candidatus Woesebacteria bacterium GW2011_GWB1_33_22]KKP46456.1 MAG: polymerase III delta subunit protein [Microgenomates group bacterium GW2011_GWC1_33_28]KKP50919.1 MAG: hypothetical protein UR41_C0002G0083 [Candidatus Woesebacteria bact
MHAFLLLNTDPEEFAKKIEAKIIPFSLQKIEDARDLKKIIKFTFNEKTAIVINDIDKATEEASNAFLKNLEEPNKNIIYILTATNLNNVLPTIVSRCEVIKLESRIQNLESSYQTKEFLGQSLTKKFEMVGKIKERIDAIEFVNNLILTERENNNYKNMENYLYTLKNLKANGNISLQMTNLVVTMGSHG